MSKAQEVISLYEAKEVKKDFKYFKSKLRKIGINPDFIFSFTEGDDELDDNSTKNLDKFFNFLEHTLKIKKLKLVYSPEDPKKKNKGEDQANKLSNSKPKVYKSDETGVNDGDIEVSKKLSLIGFYMEGYSGYIDVYSF